MSEGAHRLASLARCRRYGTPAVLVRPRCRPGDAGAGRGRCRSRVQRARTRADRPGAVRGVVAAAQRLDAIAATQRHRAMAVPHIAAAPAHAWRRLRERLRNACLRRLRHNGARTPSSSRRGFGGASVRRIGKGTTMNAFATIADRFHDAGRGGEGWEVYQRNDASPRRRARVSVDDRGRCPSTAGSSRSVQQRQSAAAAERSSVEPAGG